MRRASGGGGAATAPHCPMAPMQPDLFDFDGTHGANVNANPAPRPRPQQDVPSPQDMDDATLISLIAACRTRAVVGLAAEAGRRRLTAAVPALHEQCRAYRGFGLTTLIPPQAAAMRALAAIGGAEARATVQSLLQEGVVNGPGLTVALSAAAALQAVVPADLLLKSLESGEPARCEAACRCPMPRTAVPRLEALLHAPHAQVSVAAACALGRLGEAVARSRLLVALMADPNPEIIAALAPVADRDTIVRLGQVARTHVSLFADILVVLDDLGDPLAAVIADRLRKGQPR